jgi:hypothetical protein
MQRWTYGWIKQVPALSTSEGKTIPAETDNIPGQEDDTGEGRSMHSLTVSADADEVRKLNSLTYERR